jgi:Domain of unknown function (DUF4386)
MTSNRKTAIIVGILFIIATVAPLVSVLFIGSIYETDYLSTVSANGNQVLIGSLLWLVMTTAIVSIPILMYPLLKKYNESLALGYVGARIFEGFFSAFNIISLLSLLSLSREFVNATAPVTAYFQTSGALILSSIDWSSLLLDFPFTLSALVLNYILYKSKLIPRWLSILGLIGGSVWLATIPFRLFGIFPPELEFLAFVIFVQEMIFAIWLIVKGFNEEIKK